MTLQPIIENYFKHTEDIHSGLLTVAAEMQGNWLHIKIRDNGNGIAPERLLGIQQQLLGLHSARDVQEQIGLLNVLIRLQYYFGSDTKILLSSPEEQGVLVDLVIPVKKGGYHI
jgi:two-component system sensor histidine kinase YesM